MAKSFKPVTHVIFDMDGVLLNTEILYTEVYQKLCAQYGKIYDWHIKLKLMGKKPQVAAQQIVDELELPLTAEEWNEKSKSGMEKLFPTAALMPGAEKLVKHLQKKNVPIAICTGSSKSAFGMKSTNHKEFFGRFHHITLCGDDPEVKNGKPNPDAYIVSNSRFDPAPSPDKVLVIEDAPNGVIAGIRAGMQVLMVPDPEVPEEFTKDATLVLKSLVDFNPEDFGLPGYET